MNKYPLNIKATKPIAFTHPNDIRTGAMRFCFEDGAPEESVKKLLNELPVGYSISFFDADFPQLSDPGAYFEVLHYEADFYIKAGNHGWMTTFKKESVDNLVRLILACRGFNTDEHDHFTCEKYLYEVTTCTSFSSAFNEVYNERLDKLRS